VIPQKAFVARQAVDRHGFVKRLLITMAIGLGQSFAASWRGEC
jgi:hypothetical protein